MYRFLLTRQWVIITVVAIALIPTMIWLGFWQLHRHDHRQALNKLISTSLAAEPVPVETLTSVGGSVAHDHLYRRVTAHGHFDTAHELVVRRRTNADDRVGYHVLTPFVLDDGRMLLVNRGWIPSPTSQTAFPAIPAPAEGEITVTGRLMPDETTAESGIKDVKGLPDRQIMLINSKKVGALLRNSGDTSAQNVLGGYIELTSPAPENGSPQLLPSPKGDSSWIGVDDINLPYAIQWWLFAACVPVGWLILARREVRDRRAAERTTAGQENEPAAV
ncbi:SURF1 family cytochrome oxidase biogenesis protein [Streptomyces thermodiastaticus]|uniref:SURF1 family cytochrome oxidase biogenesis protein n=1 Tax=Streptomyces thermodiastaticus TaxID=44061 RepID=UPI00167A6E04|nr:SURF1 family protein [Streptomyces thermodiastaticus]MCE7551509.1 SURF1 family protein [Streptomyces thermodiastaticus]GHF64128.1 SURF1-like protein [Streptomyces thermodiastaticus]